MKEILRYLQDYARKADKKLIAAISFFVALLIFLNYYFRLHVSLYSPASFGARFSGFFLLFLFIFGFSYLLVFLTRRRPFPSAPFFYALIALAPALFALKIVFTLPVDLFSKWFTYPWDRYLQLATLFPLKGALVFEMVCLLWDIGGYGRPVAGLSAKKLPLQPYFILLAAMIPLIAAAGMTQDFQEAYPKLRQADFISGYTACPWLFRIIYELSYGLDFFTIEFFFRGFLTLAFIRYAGKDAILPMAAFYCAIHFGKPLAECISSYFGGLLLGVIIYHTQSIWGGLIVHVGIAWLMEAAGYWL